MATQIMVTPTLRGQDAKNILKQIKNVPTEESKLGAKILSDFFKDKTKF